MQPLKIDANTELYGIFGNPVKHSLSPRIHNAEFQRLGINAVYTAFEVHKESLGLAFEAIRSLNIRGVNITVPFKEEAIEYVDEIPEDLDRGIGALNTIVNRNGTLLGYNTDAPGFISALQKSLDFKPQSKNILVLGAGGAARAVAFALAYTNAEKIWIHNRTFERATGLIDYLTDYFPETEFDAVPELDALKREKIDLVVNATSAGLNDSDVLPMDLKVLGSGYSVYDLVYKTGKETKFVSQAKALGRPAAGGISMLAAQAALSFKLWTGRDEDVLKHMTEALK